MGDGGIERLFQRRERDLTRLPDVYVRNVVFVHAHGDLHVGEVHQLHNLRAGANLVALLHQHVVHRAREFGLYRFAAGQPREPVALLHAVAVLHVQRAHGAVARSRHVAGRDHAYGAGKAERVGDAAASGGVGIVGRGDRLLQLRNPYRPQKERHDAQQEQKHQPANDARDQPPFFLSHIKKSPRLFYGEILSEKFGFPRPPFRRIRGKFQRVLKSIRRTERRRSSRSRTCGWGTWRRCRATDARGWRAAPHTGRWRCPATGWCR